MGRIRRTDDEPLLRRLRTSDRSPSPEQQAVRRAFLEAGQPSFRTAVLADTRLTARYRGERHEFRSRVEAVAQVIRLACVTDSFLAQVCYRAEVSCRIRRIPFVPAILHRASVRSGQLSIGPLAMLEPGIYLPHGQVVIDGITCVRSGVVIRPFVTLGLLDGNPYGPNVGARTRIGTGAKLLGSVRVGADAQVGANAVVISDVPAGTTVAGVPARPLRPRPEAS